MIEALGFQELDGNAAELGDGDLVALADPILNHGGCGPARTFELGNLALELASQ